MNEGRKDGKPSTDPDEDAFVWAKNILDGHWRYRREPAYRPPLPYVIDAIAIILLKLLEQKEQE